MAKCLSFLGLNSIPFCIYIYHIFFIHPCVGENLLPYLGSHRFSGSYGSSIFSFLRHLPSVFPQWLYQFVLPPKVYEGSLFFLSSPNFLFVFFLMIAILTGVKWWFWFAFPWWLVMLSIFSWVCWNLFGTMSIQFFLPLLNWENELCFWQGCQYSSIGKKNLFNKCYWDS